MDVQSRSTRSEILRELLYVDDLVADDLVDWQKDLKRSKSKQTELMMSGRKGKENVSIR